MFTSVLIANRGEIARRVIATCARLGIRTVAIHTAADAGAIHVREAATAIEVTSYLDIDSVVAAALATGARAVHPGYGFLSERADAARAVEKAGLIWIGPAPDVIEVMGRKDAARELAVEAGVPVVPSITLVEEGGHVGPAGTLVEEGAQAGPAATLVEEGAQAGPAATLVEEGAQAPVSKPGGGSATGGSATGGFATGGFAAGGFETVASATSSTTGGATSSTTGTSDFPVLVKAAAGGGGKGMRVVHDPAGLEEAMAAARREALSAFGDDTLLLEKYVERGRHIEVQVFGDAHGTVLHLHERDCSTQRRHQKVLEEAPAPTLTDEQRRRVHEAAVALASRVGYGGAGTVEFLLDDATGDAYFLEMNTRLQVEHPVTEAVVRVGGEPVDLVEWQLLVAAGEPLPAVQEDITVSGHAIEARVYAEDPYAGYLPQAGRATYVQWPPPVVEVGAQAPVAKLGGGFETGGFETGGFETGGFETVASATSSTTGMATSSTTGGFGDRVARAQRGRIEIRVDHALESGQVVSTGFDPMLGKVIAYGPDREAARRGLVAALDDTAILGLTTNTGFLRALAASEQFRDATIDTAWLDRNDPPPLDAAEARRLAAWEAYLASARTGPFAADGFRLGGPPAPVTIELDEPVTLTGAPPARRPVAQVGRHHVEIAHHGQRWVFRPPDPAADHGATGDGTLLAPMPGTVIDVRAAEGDVVEEGQVIVVLEAMKMELALKAPYAGRVVSLAARAGAQVALGAVLAEVVADE